MFALILQPFYKIQPVIQPILSTAVGYPSYFFTNNAFLHSIYSST